MAGLAYRSNVMINWNRFQLRIPLVFLCMIRKRTLYAFCLRKANSLYTVSTAFDRAFCHPVGCAQERRCHDWGPTETTEYRVTGYSDASDCGLGGRANSGTIASYGWHYCNNVGRRPGLNSQSEYQNPSANTGCGHNDRESRGPLTSGDGTLWIK